ncbi:MAG: DUF4113 domain-containing protein [Thermodesulfobacteriota bacterium]
MKFNHIKNKNRMSAMDSINAKWGREIVRYGASGYERPWCMKRTVLSPEST